MNGIEAKNGSALAMLGKATKLLAECTTIDEAKHIRDQAEAVRVYCKQQSDSLDAQNYASEIKLRAERKCGQLLAKMEKPKGGRPTDGNRSHDVTGLSDLGISKMQSHRWQTEATVDDESFEQFVRSTHESRRELTSVGLYKLGKKTQASIVAVAPPTIPMQHAPTVGFLSELTGKKFGCIYADPPWKYNNQKTRAATSDHYLTLTVDELCEWPVGDIAAADSHLHMWTTNAFLPDAFRVIKAWGFEYRSCFVWVKPQMGIGNYWRVSHEFLLLGIRGKAKHFNSHGLKSWGEFARGRHSAKPEEIRDLIEKASGGPYLELFGRKPTKGWTVLGNKIEERLFA